MAPHDDATALADVLRRHFAGNVHADVIDASALAAQMRADFPALTTAEIEAMIVYLAQEFGIAVLVGRPAKP